jgi:hypothetical protein
MLVSCILVATGSKTGPLAFRTRFCDTSSDGSFGAGRHFMPDAKLARQVHGDPWLNELESAERARPGA